jgi:hypothetical protein
MQEKEEAEAGKEQSHEQGQPQAALVHEEGINVGD